MISISRTCDMESDRTSLLFVMLNFFLLMMAFALDAVGADQELQKHHRKTEIKCGGEDDYITLQVDQACLEVYKPPGLVAAQVYAQSSECVGCDYWSVAELNGSSFNSNGSSAYIATNTTSETLLKVLVKSDGGQFCKMSYRFGEFGSYLMKVYLSECQITIVRDPVHSALPILYAFLAMVALAVAWRIFNGRYETAMDSFDDFDVNNTNCQF